MRYLVLGSEGQIGKPLVNFLKNQNHEVEEYDIRANQLQDLRFLEQEEKRKEFVQKISKCDFVFFLAFDVGGSKYLSKMDEEFDFIHNNIMLMKNSFQMLRHYKKPFIFTSTQMSDMIHSSYGNAKLIGEKYTKSLDGLCVKLWNVYGPEFDIDQERRHVVTDFVLSAKENGHIKMRTSGQEKRQFLYVDDCCEALYLLSKRYNEISKEQPLHISNFIWTSIEDVAKLVCKACGCNYSKGKKKDSVQMALQYEPDKEVLKFWKPKTSLESGIYKIIQHYLERKMSSV